MINIEFEYAHLKTVCISEGPTGVTLVWVDEIEAITQTFPDLASALIRVGRVIEEEGKGND